VGDKDGELLGGAGIAQRVSKDEGARKVCIGQEDTGVDVLSLAGKVLHSHCARRLVLVGSRPAEEWDGCPECGRTARRVAGTHNEAVVYGESRESKARVEERERDTRERDTREKDIRERWWMGRRE
jgi:hypothetical protein